jgi:two-component system, LytTR family, sensor kinase
LTAFSTLLRESLQNGEKEYVPLSIELKTLETYIKLENLRFPFVFSLDIDKNLDTNALEIPYLLLQPLVENAIKHGVSSLYEKGILKLHIYKKDSHLIVEISDNGKGFKMDKEKKGYGLKLTKERIRLLNQANPEQPVTPSIVSNDAGTKVQLVFKNWL